MVIAARGTDLIMKQIFVHGFFHADPHPGNIFILPNNVICYLDFGMMGRIGRETRENFAHMVMSVVRQDDSRAANTLLKLTTWDQEPERAQLERDVAEFMDQYFNRPLKELNLGKLLHRLLDIASKYRMRLEPDLFLMIKALSTVEALGKILDPDFDIVNRAEPFVRRIRKDRLHPGRLAEDIIESGAEVIQLLQEVPGEVRKILTQARQGRVKMEFEHRGLEPLITAHDRISNRLAFAIVLASLVIGSSLIVLSDIPPKWHEIPVIGLVGFLIAGMMAFWLLVSILRRGKL